MGSEMCIRDRALPMLTGRVPGNGPSPVQHNRRWLAAVVLLAVLAFGAWQWQDSPRGLIPGVGTGTTQGLGSDHAEDD